MGPDKSIIVAVGRSGTTIIHRLLLEIYLDCHGESFDCLYEPFVWDSNVVGRYPRDAAREVVFGARDAMSEEGIYLHTQIPLFTDGSDVNERFADVARYLKHDTDRPLLAKFIRANGRLGLLDRLYPNGRFILVLRNPLDVVNSVLTKFSFFGAEFHKNDYPRFAADVERLFGLKLGPEPGLSPALKAALWCHCMNLFALRHAADKPNYKVVVYEDFSKNREAYAREMCAHVGAPFKDVYAAIVAKPVGRITQGAPTLCQADVDAIMPLFRQYTDMIAPVAKMSGYDADAVLRRYSPDKLRVGPVPPRGLGWSPVKLESELLAHGRALGEIGAHNRTRLAEVQHAALRGETKPDQANVPVSVVVTSFNNASTLRRAVDSVRAQSYPVAEIIVADDGSTDGSRDLLRELAREEPRLRLLMRDRNMGVSANRNDAVRTANYPFVSQLDGDDAFFPGKIAQEARALQGRDDSVAFSDTLKLEPEEYWDCSWLTGLTDRAAMAGMVSRRARLPRDMLLSKSLFQAAGGYREGCSMYEDWGFKIRLTEKARHWLYTGNVGTIYRPGGLSRGGQVVHLHGALWVLCNDAWDAVARNNCQIAAFEALLNLMKIDLGAGAANLHRMADALTPKIEVIFDEIRRDLVDKPSSAYVGREDEFLNRLQRLIGVVGFALGAAS